MEFLKRREDDYSQGAVGSLKAVIDLRRCCSWYRGTEPTTARSIRTFVLALGRDVFVCLSTEFGKSLCYALLPLVFDCLRGRKGLIAVHFPVDGSNDGTA